MPPSEWPPEGLLNRASVDKIKHFSFMCTFCTYYFSFALMSILLDPTSTISPLPLVKLSYTSLVHTGPNAHGFSVCKDACLLSDVPVTQL